MNDTFAEFVNEMQADPDMIQQALRLYLSEQTDDLPGEEMLAELKAAASSQEELQQQLKNLEQNPVVLEQATLVYFEAMWQDESQRAPIQSAFQYAKRKLPVVETAILAIVVMYGMYLLTTEGVTTIRHKTKKNADGSSEEIVEEGREPFAPILSAFARLFKSGEQAAEPIDKEVDQEGNKE